MVDLSLPIDRATGRPRGFAFVTLDSKESADKARQALDGSSQDGRIISVREFTADGRKGGRDSRGPREKPGADRTVWVGNLPFEFEQSALAQVFEDQGLGPVVRCHVPMGQDGRPRTFAFVMLSSSDNAKRAVEVLQGTDFGGRRLKVSVAQKRGERPERSDNRGPGSGGSGPPRSGGYGGGGGGYAPSGPPLPKAGFDEPRRTDRGRKKDRDRDSDKKRNSRRSAGGQREQKNWGRLDPESWDDD